MHRCVGRPVWCAVVLAGVLSSPDPVVAAEVSHEVAGHIENLRDDAIRGNARESLGALSRLGPSVIPALENALEDSDYQLRQCAAQLLVHFDGKEVYSPSRRFLQVLVEGMQSDGLPSELGWRRDPDRFRTLCNAQRAVYYFRDQRPEQIQPALPNLYGALVGTDGQQRFLSAVVLASHPSGHRYVDMVAPILIAHLADNRLRTDATAAAPAMVSIGLPAVPYLERAAGSADPQQALYAGKILADIYQEAPTKIRWRRPHVCAWSWTDPDAFPDRDGIYRKPDPPPRRYAAPPDPIRFTVFEGDTLRGIARLFIVSEEALAKANGLTVDAELTPGMVLTIPPSEL